MEYLFLVVGLFLLLLTAAVVYLFLKLRELGNGVKKMGDEMGSGIQKIGEGLTQLEVTLKRLLNG